MLRSLLQDRFGDIPEGVGNRIEAITDLEQLERLLLQAYRVERIDQLQL
jgi:hypothetical protein